MGGLEDRLRSGSENLHIIYADSELSAAQASLFAESKGKHCAQHVFLMKTSVLCRTSVLYRKTWKTKTERERKRNVLQKFANYFHGVLLYSDIAERLISS